MKTKSLLITVALLAASSTIVYVTQKPSAPQYATTDARNGQPLVDSAVLEKATQLRFTENGKTVTLAKSADNLWRVATYHNFPADFSRLSRLTDDLAAAKIERFVTAQPDRLARLDFKDTTIALFATTDADAKPLWSVTLGKTSDSGSRFPRFGDEQKAYAARLNVYLDTESKNWADTALVPIKTEDIASAELAFPNASALTVARENKNTPFTATHLAAGQQLNANALTSLLNTLTSLRFSDTSATDDPNAQAARTHARTFKLTTFDGTTLSTAPGRKPAENKITAPAKPADPAQAAQELLNTADAPKPTEAIAAAVETETIPAGPVFAFVAHSDSTAPINAQMQKRAHQIYEFTFTNLAEKPDAFFEPAPAPAPVPAAK